jgi:hypothetical protein
MPSCTLVATTAQDVRLRIDGEAVDFYSSVVGRHLPAVMARGHVMVSVRLFDEMLHAPLSLQTVEWGVFRVGEVAFKLGVKEAFFEVPMIGGNIGWGRPLPVAPQYINNSIYVPLRVFAERMGHKVAWDSTTRTVSIIRWRPRKKSLAPTSDEFPSCR